MASVSSISSGQNAIAIAERRVQQDLAQVQADSARLEQSQDQLDRDQQSLNSTQQQGARAAQASARTAEPNLGAVQTQAANIQVKISSEPAFATAATLPPPRAAAINTQGQTIGTLIDVVA